ncbi:polysaccharide biosynthesis protein [Calothrix parasitica NIES-267]|uniref:Polysaccharide biosynthesis protein n=1 Tax=Calothrix parasitica NIES-267 TaxID=1973488 RepID=A0A1Z4LZY7_9CYAN|nr:polysaccharide biosynthesis protein [Calothrix parasitica NIES-267]
MQKSKPLSLRRNFSWTFIGNAVYAACQWGMLVVLAKLGSPEMVGQFTLGLAVTAPIVMLTNLQLDIVQATDAKEQYAFSDYLGLRLIGTTIALVAIAIVTLWTGYSLQTSLVILLVGLAKAFESVSDIFHGLIQQHERMDRIAISLMIKGPLSLLLLGLGVFLSGNVVWGVAGLVFAWAVVLVGCDIRNGTLILNRAPKIRLNWKTVTKLVWLCLPLGLVKMLISLNANVPRYFIEEYLGERQLGIFAALAYLMVAGNMVIFALGESASPRLAKYYAAQNITAFRGLLLKLVGLAALIGGTAIVVAQVAGTELLTLLYRPEYAENKNLFVLLMVAAAIGYMSSFLGYGMTAARYFRVQTPLFIIVTATSAMTCLWLLPTQGLIGAAKALIFAAIVQAVFSLGVIIHAIYKLKRTEPDESNSEIN